MNRTRGIACLAARYIVVLNMTVAAAAELPAAPVVQDWRVAVRKLAAEHFKNPAWGYSHCLRDYALARELAAADHVMLDDDVLYAAAFLHDIAAFSPWKDGNSDHSD